MSMITRYKKNGGFLQLLQVMETCGSKKFDQFINIIETEDQLWALAIKQKMITFDRILTWDSELLLDIIGHVNKIAFINSLKSLSETKINLFFTKIGSQESKKIERLLAEANPTSSEISSSIIKIISETRALIIAGTIRIDKFDSSLVIPENFEEKINQSNFNSDDSAEMQPSKSYDNKSNIENSGSLGQQHDFEKLQKKIFNLNKEIQNLKQENSIMKDKLDKIKKIA